MCTVQRWHVSISVGKTRYLSNFSVSGPLAVLSLFSACLAAQPPVFERDVQPILAKSCIGCHMGAKAQAGLDLSSLDTFLKGSKNGPVVVKGASERSFLIRKLRKHEMPPAGVGTPLSEDEIVTIASWIDLAMPETAVAKPKVESAPAARPTVSNKDRQFWSFIRPVRGPVPKVKSNQLVRSPIDGFVLSKLEQKGLSFSPEASKLALMRRAYFDLTGLPPSPEQVQAYSADKKPDAYERLIDRLLASPAYGERWGRYWLDVAGYADTKSIDNDQALQYVFPNNGIWRYRDYVVRSFNEDKPYDRFVTEQLAGDELVDWRNARVYTPEIRDALTATGYLRNVTNRRGYDAVFQAMETVSSGLLGLSVGCARCHTHKYDPIPHQDYYRMAANFAPVYMYKEEPKEEVLPDASRAQLEELARYNAEIDRPLEDLTRQRDSIRSPHEKKLFQAKLASIPPPIRADLEAALAMDAKKRSPVQNYLVLKFGGDAKVTITEVDAALTEAERATSDRLTKQIEGLKSWKREHGKIAAAWEEGETQPFHLLFRGDVKTPGPVVNPGFLTVLSPAGQNDPPASDPNRSSTGRRLAFARWLTSTDHPLTARVMVNRIWQEHFGVGIVTTPDNFGQMGVRPTHPELLDWLAVDFMENGWKVKRLHKLIMTSTVYRQQSNTAAAGAQELAGQKVDPSNSLLWRMNLRRLEAEVVRDSVLAIAGNLDLTVGGPPLPLEIASDGLTTVAQKMPETGPFEKIDGAYNPSRRSIYIFARRNYPVTFLEVFDFPIMSVNCTHRVPSATPLQSLALLNSQFMMEQSAAFAARVTRMAGPEAIPEKKVDTAFLIALSRQPTAREQLLSVEHLQKIAAGFAGVKLPAKQAEEKALASLCQMLLATNEFLYIE